MDMTRLFSRYFLAEGLAVLGICFGAWLLHQAFQPTSDTPLTSLVLIGGFDIFICFCTLGYLLRLRLQDGQRLPKGWIVLSVILIAALLGWVSALLMDADRLRAELRFRQHAEQHLTQM